MLRVRGVFVVLLACLGASPLHADERLSPAAASPQQTIAAKWQNLQRRIAEDEARLAACRAEPWMCSDDETKLDAIAELGRAREGRARVGEINRAVNLAIRPVSDERQFGVIDHWAGPLETIAS